MAAKNDTGGKKIKLQFIGGSRAGSAFEAAGGQFTLGRRTGCDVRMDDKTDVMVSGRHAQVSFEEDAWWFTDLGSTNGSLVNGKAVTGKARLHTGDYVDLGQDGAAGTVRFEVHIEGEAPQQKPAAPSITGTAAGAPNDTFEFRCIACGATNRAPYRLVGKPTECKACGSMVAVPMPAVSPFGGQGAQPQAAPTAPPQQQPHQPQQPQQPQAQQQYPPYAPPGGGEGGWNPLRKIKKAYGKLKEKRELQNYLQQLESQRAQAQQYADHQCAQLAQAMWSSGKVKWSGIGAADALKQADGARAAAQQQIDEAGKNRDAADAEWKKKQEAWQKQHAKLEEAAQSARQQHQDAAQAQQEQDGAIRQMLAPVAKRLTEAGAAINHVLPLLSNPTDDLDAQVKTLADQLRDAGDDAVQGVKGMSQALKKRSAAAAKAAEAAQAARDADNAVQDSKQQHANLEQEHQQSLAALSAKLTEAQRSLSQIDGQCAPMYAALGKAVIEKQMAAAQSFEQYRPGAEALSGLNQLDGEIHGVRQKLSGM